MRKIKRIATGDEILVAKQPVHIQGIWECGDQRFTDPHGDEYVVVDWVDPAELAADYAAAIPASVSMRQARLALLSAGLLTQVNTAIAAMPGTAGEAARIEWEYATEVRRDSPLIAALAPALGMTDAQIDALFVSAAGL